MKLSEITESRGHKIIATKLKDIESRSATNPPEVHICDLKPQIKQGGCTACRRMKSK
jgi:succinylarginine dihydrolase